jgi:tetratricopeptide (TPR) repeat protein
LALVSYFLESHPGHDQALAVKARALSDLGQAEQALALYDQVGAKTPAETLSWARAFMATGQWSRAAPLLTRVVTQEPNNSDALYFLTSCHIRLGKLDKALETAKQLADLPGYEASGQVTLAAIYNDLGNLEESAAAYERATDLSPDGSAFPLPAYEVFSQYGSVLLMQGKAEEAVRVLDKSLANQPTATAYLTVGDALSQVGRTEEARQAWEMSLKLDNKNGSARESLANAALVRGEPEAGLEYLKPLIAAGQMRQSTAYLLQRLHTRLNHAEEAEHWRKVADDLRIEEERSNAIEQLLVRSPDSFWAKVIRAHRFAADGNWTQAEILIDEAYSAPKASEDKFVAALYKAIKKRSRLPSLDEAPITNF